jgi:2-methylcitrate dehydratase PrpD
MADIGMNRRSFLQLAGVGVGFTALPLSCSPELGKSTKNDNGSTGDVMSDVCSYVSKSGAAGLPPEVVEKAKHHILDTLTAMVTGAEFKVGGLAIDFARGQGGVEEAQVVGSNAVTTAINAALANGIMAHADETDDSHEPSGTHPGCAVVPAALSVAERQEVDGMAFLKGVVVGYDVGCRITQALGRNLHGHANYGVGGSFGAAIAAAAILRLEEGLMRYVFDYAAQQASGVSYWRRDTEHIEKAFVFGGMPARNGATAALLVHSGFTGVWDCFSGQYNFLDVFSTDPEPEVLAEGLGRHFEIMVTNIKKYPVGSPLQAPLDALTTLINEHDLTPGDVESVLVRMPSIRLVEDNPMPDVNLPYILAVTLLDGHLAFEAAHSYQRMKDPAVRDIRKKITLKAEPELRTPETGRTGIVEVTKKDGTILMEHVKYVLGTAQNPMTTQDVEKKCRGLLTPVLGDDRAGQLIDTVWNLERVNNVCELRPLLSKTRSS